MRIKRVSIGGFGKFRDFDLDLDPKFSIVAGLNEAGKTTIAEAITAVLFGFSGPRKELYNQYMPWDDPKNYRASILISAADGRDYLVGRDFSNGRIEVFRCEGYRLEATQEGFLQHLIRTELGVTNPLLFEHALLFREKNMSQLDRDSKSRNALARLLGESMTTPGGGASWGAACSILENRRRERAEKGEKERLLQRVNDLRERLEKEEQRYWRSLCMDNVLDELDRELTEKKKSRDELKLRLENCISLEALEERKKQLLERIELLDKEEERLLRLREETMKRLAASSAESPVLSDEELVRCEEILSRLSMIDVEKRYRKEQSAEAAKTLEIMEKEAEDLRNKIVAIGEFNSDMDRQSQITSLVYRLNEAQRVFLNTKPIDEEKEKGSSGFLRTILWIITGLGAFGISAILVYEMSQMMLLGAAALESMAFGGALIATIRHGSKRRKQSRRVEEMIAKEEEIRSIQSQLQKLLGGKTYDEYQAENQRYRLYENDLWHLENTIAQQRTLASTEDLFSYDEEILSLQNEIKGIMLKRNAFDQMAWREAVEQERYLRLVKEQGTESEGSNWETELDGIRHEKSKLKLEADSIMEQGEERVELPELQASYEVLDQEVRELELQRAEKATEGNVLAEQSTVDSWELANRLEEEERRLKKWEMEDSAIELAIKELMECGGDSEETLGPQIQRLTSEYLAILTKGSYPEIRLKTMDNEFKVEVRNEARDQWLLPSTLSTGTLDQIYLAFRLALAETMTNSAEYLLLLDDPFIHFDKERLAEAVSLMKKLSDKHQIIWWSKDSAVAKELTGIEPIMINEV